MRRVFVYWSNPLFIDSVRQLLRHPDVEIVGESAEYAVSRAQIHGLKPDVVIVEKDVSGDVDDAHSIGILRTGARLIKVSLSKNDLSVYERQQRTMTNADDLLNLILEKRCIEDA
jgi:AmiR/NasT family two-component response regulator